MHISIAEMVTANATITIANLSSNMKSPMGFRIARLDLTLAYSKDELHRWNDMPPNFWPSR